MRVNTHQEGLAVAILYFLLILLAAGFLLGTAALAEIRHSELTPDGEYRIEISDREWPGVFEAYRSRPWQPPGGGLRLSGVSLVDWDVESIDISDDSQWVLSTKSCGQCLNGGSDLRYVLSHISGGPVVWQAPDIIFRDGFESGTTEAWE